MYLCCAVSHLHFLARLEFGCSIWKCLWCSRLPAFHNTKTCADHAETTACQILTADVLLCSYQKCPGLGNPGPQNFPLTPSPAERSGLISLHTKRQLGEGRMCHWSSEGCCNATEPKGTFFQLHIIILLLPRKNTITHLTIPFIWERENGIISSAGSWAVIKPPWNALQYRSTSRVAFFWAKEWEFTSLQRLCQCFHWIKPRWSPAFLPSLDIWIH